MYDRAETALSESSGPTGVSPDRLHEIALSYLDKYPWTDVAAVEANLAVIEAGSALVRALARFIAPFGFALGPPRYLVVRALFLAENNRLSPTEIARRIGVSTTSITNLIDGLEKDGWVERQANPSDRRVTYVRLTDEGSERCTELIPAVSQFTGQLFGALTEEEKDTLIRTLTKLRRAAETSRPLE